MVGRTGCGHAAPKKEATWDNHSRRCGGVMSANTRLRTQVCMTSEAPAEPLLHSHVTDALAPGHPLAGARVYCDRCDALLHMQTNSCMRTWIESGRGNFCVRCFIVTAGGLAPDDTRLGGVDCLSRSFGLHGRGTVRSEAGGAS